MPDKRMSARITAMIRAALEQWTPANDSDHYLKSFILHRLDVRDTPALYDAELKSLTCPHCGFQGVVDGAIQSSTDFGRGFRYLEDVVNHRDIAKIEGETLIVDSAYESGEGYDDGANPRLECRQCFGECAIPEGLGTDFI